ncbi:MAG: adenosylmethionine decarboxylase [Bacteroidia bacterium]|nr:adenosylmethionine decarboxylase [Bacteroidia bacterium]
MNPVGTLQLFRAEGLSFDVLDTPTLLMAELRSCLAQAGATVVAELVHRFEPQGVTGVFVLKESHCAFHSWPELGVLTVDVFTCGPTFQPKAFVGLLELSFGCHFSTTGTIQR